METESENILQDDEKSPSLAAWGRRMKVAVCENCDWQFLFQEEQVLSFCPHCYQRNLVSLSQETSQQIVIDAPELVLSSGLQSVQINQIFQSFAGGNWFPPIDFNVKNLVGRTTLIFLPIWLVDSAVQATWKAEAGYNYQVLSHQDRFDDNRGGWSSQEVQEMRIRWEPRIGQLQRFYQNHTSPALNEYSALMQQVGSFDLASAKPYDHEALPEKGWAACLPNRSTADSWGDAHFGFQASAVKECQQACQADALRNFSWEPTFTEQKWTLLLVPVFSSFYFDDDGKPQALLINGLSGKLGGVKRASIRRARKTSLLLLSIAACSFLISLFTSFAGVIFPLFFALGVIGFILTLLVGLSALAPFIIVWKTNR